MKNAVLAVRLLLLTYVGYSGVRHLTDPEYGSLFGAVEFGTHEFGHMVFAFFGEWLTVAGGSIAQVAIPVLVALLFWRQKERVGIAVCGGWLAISLAQMAVYMADARALELDLLSFSPDADTHDWNYLFKSLGIIQYDVRIGTFVRHVGWLALAASLVYGVWAAWRAARAQPAEAAGPVAEPPSGKGRAR